MADEKKPMKAGGRPRKFDNEGRRTILTFRARGGLYERLSSSADRHQLSMSEEIERRLRRSFVLGSLYDSREETEDLTAMLNSAIIFAQARTGKSWRDDIKTRRLVSASLHKIAEVIGIGDGGENRDAVHIDRECTLIVEQAGEDINPEVGIDPDTTNLVG